MMKLKSISRAEEKENRNSDRIFQVELGSTFRAEEKVEVGWDSIRGSAAEALRVMFTPLSFLVGLIRSRRHSADSHPEQSSRTSVELRVRSR